jgi:hypothetical protein
MNNNWSQLRPLSKLDQLAETIMKSAFLMSENHHVIQSYLNHKGANFKIKIEYLPPLKLRQAGGRA